MAKLFLCVVILVLLFSCITKSSDINQADPKVPDGFNMNVIADRLGNCRHLAVNTNGDLYIKLGSLKEGNGILVLRNNHGVYKLIRSFGNFAGTGILIQNGYLYASSDNEVFRYTFGANNEIENENSPDKIVSGLVAENEHAAKSIALDGDGNLYVDIGAPSNACQVLDRVNGSPGQDPCPLLDKTGGIWRFRSGQFNQGYKEGSRFVTGIRNMVALRWNPASGQLYGVQHGRDQLDEMDPAHFSSEKSSELPAEEFLVLKQGNDFGWPYCFYDQIQKKKVLGPEYGGDGKVQGRCADKDKPIMAFPGHWAPNDLLFYTGKMFPEKYRNGAFIAFHGSWNRHGQQQGYSIVFVPFKNGLPSGNYEIFADGFAGRAKIEGSGQAKYRPCGLAQDADGALYVCDDNEGRVWKISYGK
jgi:glucose/arabinose dehydrogenase